MLPKVKLVYTSDLYLINQAINKSRGNFKSGDIEEVKKRIKKIGIDLGHESVLEHSLISFDVVCSRAALQEIARHRIGVSMTVRSTRYTIKKDYKEIFTRISNHVLNEFETFNDHYDNLASVYNEYVVSLIEPDYSFIANFFEYIEWLSAKGIKITNDNIKQFLPEYYRTEMLITFNLRSLLHFLRLRLDKAAWHELRYVAYLMIESLPNDFMDLVLYDSKISKLYYELKFKLKNLIKNGKTKEQAVRETFVVNVQ